MIRAIAQLRGMLEGTEAGVEGFRFNIGAIPGLTTDLNRAKRAVNRALQPMIDLLRRHQQNLERTEKSAMEVFHSLGGARSSNSIFAGLQADQNLQQADDGSWPLADSQED